MQRSHFAFVILLLVCAAQALPAAEEQTYRGTVSLTRKGDMVTAISLRTSGGTYSVWLDQYGRQLARFEGKEVSVPGKLIRKGSRLELRVTGAPVLSGTAQAGRHKRHAIPHSDGRHWG